jgi:hypothetical protein
MRWINDRSGAAECLGGRFVAGGIERRVYTPHPTRQGESGEFSCTSTSGGGLFSLLDGFRAISSVFA